MIKIQHISAVILFILLGASSLFAQNILSTEIKNHKSRGEVFEMESEVFRTATALNSDLSDYFISPSEITFLDYNPVILKNDDRFISLEIPFKSTFITLDLINVSDQFMDYSLVTHGKRIPFLQVRGNNYYRGIVNGDENSVVSLSFFQDNVLGVISTNEGNYNLVKLKNSDRFYHL